MQGQGPGPSLRSPTSVGPQRGPVFCFTGTVELKERAPAPQAGRIVGQLVTGVGVAVPLIQPAPAFSTTQLSNVNKELATVCGAIVLQDGHLAVEVAFVSPGVSTLTPGVSPLALTVLALLGLLPVSG